MITLRTGLPGASKTLFALYDYVVRPPDGKALSREVFVSGVPELDFSRLPGVSLLDDPTRWMDCPAGSLVLIDEAQRIFRGRPPGAPVPDYVAALETHRHLGIDIVVITQDPMLIDPHLRRLVGEHFHFHRAFGFNGATQYRWQECKTDPKDYHAKKEAEKSRRKFPKKIFSYYKSAEIHTVKRKIPFRAWVTLGFLIVAGPVIYYVYYRISHIGADAISNDKHVLPKTTGPAVPIGSIPTVYQSNHPLAAFHAASLQVRTDEIKTLPKLSTHFRLVGSIGSAGAKSYVATSRTGHYVLIPHRRCKMLDGLPVCRWAGGYVSLHEITPKQSSAPGAFQAPASSGSHGSSAANPLAGVLP